MHMSYNNTNSFMDSVAKAAKTAAVLAEEGATTLVRYSKDACGTVKTMWQAAECEREIVELQRKLGERVCQVGFSEEDPAVIHCKEQIEKKQEQLARLKKRVVCPNPNCGQQAQSGDRYCCVCGTAFATDDTSA